MNASGIDVPPGATALDAVRAWDASAAADVEGGRRMITDSRGLPLDAAATKSAGSIIRLVAKRDRGAAEDRAE